MLFFFLLTCMMLASHFSQLIIAFFMFVLFIVDIFFLNYIIKLTNLLNLVKSMICVLFLFMLNLFTRVGFFFFFKGRSRKEEEKSDACCV